MILGSGRSAGEEVPVFLGFPCCSAGKESTCNAGDLGSIPWLGRSPGEGKGYPLQYSGLENSTDSIVYEVAKSQTRLSNFHNPFLTLRTNSLLTCSCNRFCTKLLKIPDTYYNYPVGLDTIWL